MFYFQNKHNSQVVLAVKVSPVEVAVEAVKSNYAFSLEIKLVEVVLGLIL